MAGVREKRQVFVSYQNDDSERVEALVDRLKMRGIDVWYDRDQVDVGDDFVEEMKRGIDESYIVLVCIGLPAPGGNGKSWHQDELRMALLDEKTNGSKRIIPVLFHEKAELPSELGTRSIADLSDDNEWERNFSRLVRAIKKQELALHCD